MKERKREANSNWRGGRSVTEHGYILLRVGVEHHLADVRGYAYEHRVVAEQVMGRHLRSGEIAHHKNGIRSDNRPQNIEIIDGISHHWLKHRKHNSGRRLPGQENTVVFCVCGCGIRLKFFDKWGRPRRFVSGHNTKLRNKVAVNE